MKVVFVDIDGVICTNWEERNEFEGHSFCPLNQDAVKLLNELTDKTKAFIVISSTWRLGDRWDVLPFYLRNQGVTGKIIDKTPRLLDSKGQTGQRGNEIQTWLTGKSISHFVVLDDDSDMDAVKDNFVQTLWVNPENGELVEGLRPEHIEKAIKILGE